MGGFKDKDLIKDGCGLTKHRHYGQNKRPPRIEQRKNQRERYLNKDEKKDMSAQELDFKLDDNGQVYVQEEPSNNQVLTFKDIVQMPNDVKDIKQYHDYNIDLQQSLNDIGGGFDVEVQEEHDAQPVQFDFSDTNIKQPQVADVSNNDLILSDQQETKEEKNPFDDLFGDDYSQQNQSEENETNQQNDQQNDDNKKEQNDNQQEKDQQEKDQSDNQQDKDQQDKEQSDNQQDKDQQDKEQESNDAIDQYLKMQIDDSKLSQQNKEKLDSFTSQQMDAFKKFLYEKRNNEE